MWKPGFAAPTPPTRRLRQPSHTTLDGPIRELRIDLKRTPIASKFCVPKAQFFIHTTRLTWALDLPRPPAAAAASAGHGLQFRHLVRRCVLSLLDGCWGQTRYAGGPTQAQLRDCLSFSWPSRQGGYALNLCVWLLRCRVADTAPHNALPQ